MNAHRTLKLSLLAAAATILASCYYDPYYSGYGDGYGYASGSVTFVHTSSDRWFYDPVLYCYYDRHRRCYYDPWLGGYYPVGYCPRPIYGVRHPYGWSGRGSCPPPRNVHNHQIRNYQDRVALLQAKNYSWARNVRLRNQSNVATWQRNRLQQASNFKLAQQQAQARAAARNRNQPPPLNPRSARRDARQNRNVAPALPAAPSNNSAQRRAAIQAKQAQARQAAQSRQAAARQAAQARQAAVQPRQPKAAPARQAAPKADAMPEKASPRGRGR